MTASTTTSPITTLPQQFQAHIRGKVQYRVGDGVLHEIPVGLEVYVDTALASMVLSWTSDGQPVTVTVARDEFFYYLEEGSIHVLS